MSDRAGKETVELKGKAWIEGSLAVDGPHRWAFTTFDDVTMFDTYEARLVIVHDTPDPAQLKLADFWGTVPDHPGKPRARHSDPQTSHQAAECMTDIVERLREQASEPEAGDYGYVMREAATEIERLGAEIKRLRDIVRDAEPLLRHLRDFTRKIGDVAERDAAQDVLDRIGADDDS